MVITLPDVQAQIDVDASLVRRDLRSRARLFPGLACGISVPASTLQRGPSPVGRGKPGSKMHVLSDAAELPLVVGVSAANTHDSQALKPMVLGHQNETRPHRGRHFKPQRLHADKVYDVPELRKWLRGKRSGPCPG